MNSRINRYYNAAYHARRTTTIRFHDHVGRHHRESVEEVEDISLACLKRQSLQLQNSRIKATAPETSADSGRSTSIRMIIAVAAIHLVVVLKVAVTLGVPAKRLRWQYQTDTLRSAYIRFCDEQAKD